MAFWFLAGGLVVLVAVHITRPRFRRRKLSAARFFKDLPPPRKSSPKLSFSNPLKIPALYPRLLLLGLLMLAVWASTSRVRSSADNRYRIWFLVDTSSSMTTLLDEGNLWDRAKSAFESDIAELNRQPKSSGMFRVSLFDLALRDLGEANLKDGAGIMLENTAPRSLGTDLGMLRRVIQREIAQPSGQPFTHMVVITDQAAPAWLANMTDATIIWRDISQPRVNIGIESMTPMRNPLTSGVNAVQVAIGAHGLTQPAVSLSVLRPGERVPQTQPIQWRNDQFGTVMLEDLRPGLFELKLEPGGDYAADDTATFTIPASSGVRVDWQLDDTRLPRLLGWTITEQSPRFRVGSGTPTRVDRPYLWVGSGLVEEATEIRDFVELSPLIEDLNFDVVEQFRPIGTGPGEAFQSHLRDTENGVWAASATRPTSVFIAGLPDGSDSPADRLKTTLFFNAVRWLLSSTDAPAIYSLTTPLLPEPDATRLNLHPGEGQTADAAVSFGSWDATPESHGRNQGEPWWPRLLACASVLLLLERTLALWGGRRWH